MPKKFLSNVILLLAVNLLIKPFWILGIDRTVQNSVGNEAYGSYINLFTLSLMFTMLLDFGINNYTSTFIARHQQMLDKKFGALLPLKLLFSLSYLLVTAGFAFIYGIKGESLLIVCWLAVNQVMAFFILFFRANISGLQLFRTDSLLSVSDRGLMIVSAVILFMAMSGNFNIHHFILAQSLGYAGSLAISFFALKPHLNIIRIRFNKVLMYSILRQSWPFALLALLMTTYTRIDYLLIKKLLVNGDIQNGIYAVANRLFEAANMLAVLIATMLLPMFANMLKQQEDLSELVKVSMILLIIPAVAVASISWFYSYDIISMLSKNNPEASAEVFRYVMISFVAMCIMYIFGTLLTAGAHLKKLNILAAVAIVLNMSLNLWLIPVYGAKGAAATAVCTHGFIALSNAWYAFRLNRFNFDTKFAAVFTGVIVLIPVSAYAFRINEASLFFTIGGIGLIILVVLTATGLIKASHIRNILKSKSHRSTIS